MATQDVSIWSESDSPKVAVVDKDTALPAEGSAVVLMGAVEGTTARMLKMNAAGELIVTVATAQSNTHDGVGNPIPSTVDDEGRGLNVHITGGNATVQLPQDSAAMIFRGEFFTTTSKEEQTIVTYTVTTGKTFFLVTYSIARAANHNQKALLKVKVNSIVRDAIFVDPAGQYLVLPPIITFPYAAPGDVITLTVTEGVGVGGNYWYGKLIGFERDAI